MRKLIVNADDLGYSQKVNSEIERCINLGVVTSSTIMANAPDFGGGVEIAKKHPEISIGVHLNLIEFRPLTNLEIFSKYGLIDENKNFKEGGIFVITIDSTLKKAIFEEWDAQIQKIKDAGIEPSHVDSHEHTHTIPEMADLLANLMRKHGIKRVRRVAPPSIRLMLLESKHPSVTLDKSNAIVPPRRNIIYRRIHLFVVKFRCFRWNRLMKKFFSMTDAFYAFRHYAKYITRLNMGATDSVLELMCHPGQAVFENETKLLKQKELWLKDDITLISYRDLL